VAGYLLLCKFNERFGGSFSSHDKVISIRLFSLLILYFIGGVLWQKFRVQAQGIEVIPNVLFWMSLPVLVKV